MQPLRLSVDDLQVASFATAENPSTSIPGNTLSDCMTDPTAMTWCYICPPEPQFPDEQY